MLARGPARVFGKPSVSSEKSPASKSAFGGTWALSSCTSSALDASPMLVHLLGGRGGPQGGDKARQFSAVEDRLGPARWRSCSATRPSKADLSPYIPSCFGGRRIARSKCDERH